MTRMAGTRAGSKLDVQVLFTHRCVGGGVAQEFVLEVACHM